MPMTIFADNKFPDLRKSWPVHLDVEEGVLDEVLDYTSHAPDDYSLLKKISHPGDDFAVLNLDISGLRTEIRKFYMGIQGVSLSGEMMEYLFALDGICLACEKSGKNLYGFSD